MATTTRLRVFGAAAAAISALALTSTSLAAPPVKTDDTVIRPPGSIGAISAGQPRSDAEAAWGVGDCNDSDPQACDYGSERKGFGQIVFVEDAVYLAQIIAPRKNQRYEFTGPLMDFKTKRGDIGLGDRLAKVVEEFPRAKEEGERQVFIRDGDVRMVFLSGNPSKRRITEIFFFDRGQL